MPVGKLKGYTDYFLKMQAEYTGSYWEKSALKYIRGKQMNADKLDLLLDRAQKDIVAKNGRKGYDINNHWEK